jgi:hypothetical protein
MDLMDDDECGMMRNEKTWILGNAFCQSETTNHESPFQEDPVNESRN